jgi:AraC family transcriptional regulator
MTNQDTTHKPNRSRPTHNGVIAHRTATWNGAVCDLIVRGPTGEHEVVVAPEVDTIFMTLSGDRHPIIKRLNQDMSLSIFHPGSIVNFVAGGDTLSTYAPHGNRGMERLALSILPEALTHFDGESDVSTLSLRSALLIDRPLLHAILKALADEVTAPGTHGQLYTDSLIVALHVDLLRHKEGLQPVATKGRLAPWRLRRAEAMIRSRVTEDISLAELAREAGLSVSHFARAFRKSTGLPPHKYQLNARIELAKQLLTKKNMSLTQIGLECGFSEQSKFTRAFNRAVGKSPGAWRRENKM